MVRWNCACVRVKGSAMGMASSASPAPLLSPSTIRRRSAVAASYAPKLPQRPSLRARYFHDATEVVEVDQGRSLRSFTSAVLRPIPYHRSSSLVAPSSGLISHLSEGRVRVGFVDEPNVAREVEA
jgi:hypothetical protein